jgi:phenylalanyl-tRNA synthetase alpha chain
LREEERVTEPDTVAAVDWAEYEREAVLAIERADTTEALEAARVDSLGRKSPLALAMRAIRDRETGMLLNGLRQRLEAALAERADALRALVADAEPFDPTLPGVEVPRGTLHLITQLRRTIEDVFLGLGYEVYDGREVETVWHNFDALNQPQAHPSRDPADTFYFDAETLLRTHTSPGQIRSMLQKEPPLYLVSLGRVYRRDALDPTHTPVFHQVEGLAVDRHITLADLRGTIELFASQIFGGKREVRMRTSFFPFTEPSVEFDVTCYMCNGAGCSVCKHSGWIEMGGAGVIDPNVLETVGYDPEQWQGFAFGLGIDRIAFLRHGIPDLRLFWENDIRFLRQF